MSKISATVNFTTKQGMTALPSQVVGGDSLEDIAVKAQEIGRGSEDTHTYSIVHDGRVYHFTQDYGNCVEVCCERTGSTLAYDHTNDDE